MDVDYMVVADAATAADQKLYIHGAGWDTIWAASFPLVYPSFAVAVRVRVPWHDTNQPHQLSVDVMDADGRSVLPTPPGPLAGVVTAGRPAQMPVGEDQIIPLTMTFGGTQFRVPGTYAVVVRIDGMEVARSPIHVLPLPGAAVAGQGYPPGLPPAAG